MTYQETLKYLYDLQLFGIKLGLENAAQLSAFLNHPHRKYSTIHVAGTNGKGSTCAMVASIFQAAGYKTGLYTSPHIFDFSERIQINGVRISESTIVRITQNMKSEIDRLKCTFFEATTLLALEYFAENHVDVAIVETGLGGRLDATNIISPVISVITSIGIDHEKYLGDTLERIAREKAGIIKKNTPVVIGNIKPDLKSIFLGFASEEKSDIYFIDECAELSHVSHSWNGIRFSIDLFGRQLNVTSTLLGEHQIDNACAAIAAVLGQKKLAVTTADILSGIQKAKWPGRMEILEREPYLIADAAHNPEGMRRLANSLKTLGGGRIFLVIGMLADKDYEKCAAEIGPMAYAVRTVTPKHERALPGHALKDIFLKYANNVEDTPSVREAVARIKELANPSDIIVVTGSFFTLGELNNFRTL